MFDQAPIVQLRKRFKVMVLVGIVFALIAGLVSLAIPSQYRAEAQLLLISQSRYGVDPYTAVKSSERIGENLAQVVETSDFFNKVFAQGNIQVDRSPYEGISERKKRKQWQRDVDATVVYGTSVLNIAAYHIDPDQAKRLAGAVAQTLLGQGKGYVGGDVEMRIVNQPVASQFPVRPNIFMNVILGFLLGMLLAAARIVRR